MKKYCYLLFLSFFFCLPAALAQQQQEPINPQASSEARNLLKYLYGLQGKKTLSGMHNVIGRMSKATDSVYKLTGKYPAIWGGDFGFADSTHDIDNIKYRNLLVGEIKKQYAHGSIIVLTYHEANPAVGEPCDFEGGVISKVSDKEWRQLLTPGTELYKKWSDQMDLFASYLVQLQDAHIPIIFRPYHEMNGSWFWWGGRKGRRGYIALWNQMYDYFTNHHHLNNILWAWTTDKPADDVAAYFPGLDKVDILGCDIYPRKDVAEVYPQEWFDKMQALAKGKPLALTENGKILPAELLEKQPYLWFMSWGDMLFNGNSVDEVRKLYNDPRVLNLGDKGQ